MKPADHRLMLSQACALLGGIYPPSQVTKYYLSARPSLAALLASPEFWIDDFIDYLCEIGATPPAWDTAEDGR